MKYIKNINEFENPNIFGDTYGYNGSNGVMKITYKPYQDLSVSVGQDPNQKTDIDGSEFAIGDVVIGKPFDSKKELIGIIVRSFRNDDNYRYFIQVYNKGKKTEKVIELNPTTIKFAEGGDHGYIKTKHSNSEIPRKGYNSDTVYNSRELGLETVGG